MELAAQFLRVEVQPLNQVAFAPFGTVVEDPARLNLSSHGSLHLAMRQAMPANQGTATKYSDVSPLVNLYDDAPSQRKAAPVVSLFVCTPRRLSAPATGSSGASLTTDRIQGLFDVEILERHRYTTQTFIPMGLSGADLGTRYLVIVAPTLLTQSEQPSEPLQGPGVSNDAQLGIPDLSKIRAFLGHGAQALTYGPGTWHSPMVIIGDNSVAFMVIQFANGIGKEDCEEIRLQRAEQGGVVVAVPRIEQNHNRESNL